MDELEKLRAANAALIAERQSLIETKREQLAALQADLDHARREAADQAYMRSAYYNMLGPVAKAVADEWRENGVRRFHADWGPDAADMTGEERAQVLLNWARAPRRLVESVDSPLYSSVAALTASGEAMER